MDEAETFLLKGIEISRRAGLQDDTLSALATLARLRCAQGRCGEAVAELEQAAGLLRAYGIQRLTGLVEASLASFHLAAGRLDAARAWAQAYRPRREARVEYLREFEDLTLARVLLAEGEIGAAEGIADDLREGALAGGRDLVQIEAWLLKALLRRAAGDRAAAGESLAEAVRLAAPENIRRPFLDAGRALLDLLPGTRAAAPDFVADLIARLTPPGRTAPTPLAALPDPLSEQETRVLRLIAEGKSNQEIAEELVISVGTAKWHVHHVLQKLGVANRPQAIVRARELGY